VLQEGIHLKVPFAPNVIAINNRIVKTEVNTEAFSKDLQTVSTVIAVNYHINKSSSAEIYKQVGLDMKMFWSYPRSTRYSKP
jgi:regulator of protease activity HflC (stomatin/prohibitin superfamily)